MEGNGDQAGRATGGARAGDGPAAPGVSVSPFLHLEAGRVYNPLSGESWTGESPEWSLIRRLAAGERDPGTLPDAARADLLSRNVLVAAAEETGRRYRLRYVSLEAHTVCNQACHFCPVSVDPRKASFMPTELYHRILRELSAFRDTIEAVFMSNYNEPTVDARFLDQVRAIKAAGLPPAVLTNGSGLTPERVDALVAAGGLRYLSVNLSSLDRAEYARDRGVDQLDLVLRNLDHASDLPVAEEMDVVVLGSGDARHAQSHKAIEERFAGSRFHVRPFEVMDRAGILPLGAKPAAPHRRLRGCENLGSRPLEHLHVTPSGKCVLCCEDYDEAFEIGDLSRESVEEVLGGDRAAVYRRQAYGIEEAPEDFICRRCVFARSGDGPGPSPR